MNKPTSLLLIMLILVTTGACTQAQEPEDGIINPGDKIGKFVITARESEEIKYVTLLHCSFDEATFTESCEFPVGTKVNVSQGIFKPFSSEQSLDEIWSGMTYEMTIEGQPVDLAGFGYEEYNHEVVGTVRVWNVVISSDKPGKVTAHSTGEIGGEPIEYTAVLTFTSP